MYKVLLLLHSYGRWLLFALCVAGAVHAVLGLVRARPWTPRNERLSLITMIIADIQLLTGLVLYGWASPIVRAALANFQEAARDRLLRFWAIEHLTMMLMAIVAIHLVRVATRRAESDISRYRRTAVGLGLAVLLMAAAIPWPFIAVVGRPLFRV